MLVGFLLPFATSVVIYLRFFVNHVVVQSQVSTAMTITAVGLPIGVAGAGCWVFGLVREANLYRKLKEAQRSQGHD